MQDLNFMTPAFERALADVPPGPSVGAEFDEAYWEAIRRLYATTRSVVNLENGYWGAMAEPVKEVYRYWTDRINAESTAFIRPNWPGALDALRTIVAGALRCDASEIVLTRGATEAMLALISGYNGLRVGDKVLFCDLDYPAMRHAMAWLGERRGTVPLEFAIPEPATREGVLAAYECMFRDHPGIRLVLLTHLSHCTGLVMPVRELAEMARSFGAEVIVDAAHSWGQLDFDVGNLGAKFVAINLHKWIGAPLGCGAMYIRNGCTGAIDSYMGDRDFPADDVRSKIHTGSPNFAAWLSIPAALALHRRIGAKAKESRLRSLRDDWVSRARALPGVRILTPDDPSMVGGMTAFRIDGKSTSQENEAVVSVLRDVHGVLTVRRNGPEAGDVVRVTPAVHTSRADLDCLVAGLRVMTGA